MTKARQALASLSDATRQAIFESLSEGPKSVGQISEKLPVSRSAVSQHLKLLKEAGLVTDRAVGTKRVYRIDPAGLGLLRRWLDEKWERLLIDFQDSAESDND